MENSMNRSWDRSIGSLCTGARTPIFPTLGLVPKLVLALVFSFLATCSVQAQSVLLETWSNITGGAVTNLTSNANYPNSPTTRTNPTIFEIVTSGANSY